jgi:hypothetical protein
MHVEMREVRGTEAEDRRVLEALVAQSEELLSTSQEHRERVDRAVAEASRNIRRALLRLRRGY